MCPISEVTRSAVLRFRFRVRIRIWGSLGVWWWSVGVILAQNNYSCICWSKWRCFDSLPFQFAAICCNSYSAKLERMMQTSFHNLLCCTGYSCSNTKTDTALCLISIGLLHFASQKTSQVNVRSLTFLCCGHACTCSMPFQGPKLHLCAPLTPAAMSHFVITLQYTPRKRWCQGKDSFVLEAWMI